MNHIKNLLIAVFAVVVVAAVPLGVGIGVWRLLLWYGAGAWPSGIIGIIACLWAFSAFRTALKVAMK